MKTWDVTFEVFWSASRNKTVRVRANTERKAIMFAEKKVKNETGWDSPILRDVKLVEDGEVTK